MARGVQGHTPKCPQDTNMDPKGTQMEPKGAEMKPQGLPKVPKASQLCPMCVKMEAQGATMEPQGHPKCQRDSTRPCKVPQRPERHIQTARGRVLAAGDVNPAAGSRDEPCKAVGRNPSTKLISQSVCIKLIQGGAASAAGLFQLPPATASDQHLPSFTTSYRSIASHFSCLHKGMPKE